MQLTYDSVSNSLRLTPSSNDAPAQPRSTISLNATLDIGPGGRLIGIEFPAAPDALTLWQHDPITTEFVTCDADGFAYIQITTGPIDESRSTDLIISTERTSTGAIAAIVIPRHGSDYEISYPSGNQ